MLSHNDKIILDKMRQEYPKGYELFTRHEEQQKQIIKKGCHDIGNIATLLIGSYQLLEFTSPELKELTRWNQLGESIDYLVHSLKMISYYRHADNIKLKECHIDRLLKNIAEYIDAHYNSHKNLFDINIDYNDIEIITDMTKLSEAVFHLIDNSIEACLTENENLSPVSISIKAINDAEHNSILYINISNSHSLCETDDINKISEPFVSYKKEHIGLGLSIANKTIDALNGKLITECKDGLFSASISIPYAI